MAPHLWLRPYTHVVVQRISKCLGSCMGYTGTLPPSALAARKIQSFPRRGRCSPFNETVVVLEIKGQQLHIITKLLHAVQGRRMGCLRLGHLGPEPAYRSHGAASLSGLGHEMEQRGVNLSTSSPQLPSTYWKTRSFGSGLE